MVAYLGIEFGSTRIKATVIDGNFKTIESSDYVWKSELKNGIWTYDLAEALLGLKTVLADIKNRQEVKSVGISGMMHGYLAFDKDWNLLTPFRTWQNTITGEAAQKLTELFGFNVPQRWSIAHLYQAVLNKEEHISKVAHITTLAGYIHYLLTGVNAVGIGEASGIFPIDTKNLCYDRTMCEKFNALISKYNFNWTLDEVLPQVLVAGKQAGDLTKQGAEIIDNLLPVGVVFAAPEGDAGTGMVATNAIKERTGNISAGTSIFSMIVLERALKKVYPEIDIVTTPTGKNVAMVHCNNCTNDSNAWIGVLKETANLFDSNPDTGALYTRLYEKSLEGDADCGGVLVCNYMAGEGITHLDSGVPMVARKEGCKFTLANFMRATLYSTMATLNIGMDILKGEDVRIDSLNGHGGLFKTKGVGQKYMAAACNAPVTCMETAGEGGPYGMALLAAYLFNKGESLEAFLDEKVFKNCVKSTVYPDDDTVKGFMQYMKDYKKMLSAEEQAVKAFKE